MAAPSCIVDSNVLVALFYKQDPLNSLAISTLSKTKDWQKRINWLLLSEIGSVILLRSKNQALASEVVDSLTSEQAKDLTIEDLSKALRDETLLVFHQQSSGRLSVADCSIIAQARITKSDTILTFDKDLRHEFRSEFSFLPKLVRA